MEGNISTKPGQYPQNAPRHKINVLNQNRSETVRLAGLLDILN